MIADDGDFEVGEFAFEEVGDCSCKKKLKNEKDAEELAVLVADDVLSPYTLADELGSY
jgi:hypothetical protein